MRAVLRHPMVPLAAVTLVAVLVTLSAVSLAALQISERRLVPELQRKAVAVGLSARETVERALGYDFPIDELAGMQAFLDGYLAQGDLAYIAVADRDGDRLYAAGAQVPLPGRDGGDAARTGDDGLHGAVLDLARWLPAVAGPATTPESGVAEITRHAGYVDAALPLRRDGEPVAWLHLGTRDDVIGAQLRENLLDIATVLLLSLLLAVELLLLATVYSITGPLFDMRAVLRNIADGRLGQVCRPSGPREVRSVQIALNATVERLNGIHARLATAADGAFSFGRDGRTEALREPRLIGVRLLAFLFVVAEEVARPFSPVYFGGFADTAPLGLGPEMTAGAIMTVSMAMMALMMPVSGLLVDRIGPRRLFAAGGLVSALGMVGTGLALTFWDLALWRCLTVMGYGLCFIACQGYVVEATGRDRRARGMALFVGGIMIADMFGPAIGGILSERLGFAVTFFVGAGVAALSGVLVWRLMEPITGAAGRQLPQVRLHDLGVLLRNRRFLLVAVFAAIPAKLSLVGVLYYLTPLYLTQLAYSQADIGRVIMAYGLVALVALPIFSNLADRRLGYRRAVIVGGLIAAPCLLLVPVVPGLPVVLAAIALLGLGQALSISAQIPLATELCADEIARLGQGAVLGTLRLIERAGSAAAPLLAAVLARQYGHADAMAVFGAIALGSVVALALGSRRATAGAEADP